MKKASSKRSKTEAKGPSSSRRRGAQESASDEMRPHYDFDYGKSRPNRFASRLSKGTIAVVLDPDVATIFRSGEAVNSFLRSVISAMPTPEPAKKKRAS
jgi:hypothetical protein